MSAKKTNGKILQFPAARVEPGKASAVASMMDTEYQLEEAIEELGLAIDTEEIDAFICDALYRGQTAQSGFDRIVLGLSESGYKPAVSKRLIRIGHDFAEQIAADYCRSDQNPAFAEVRSELVDIYADFLAWMRQLGAYLKRREDIQTEDFKSLTELMSAICESLRNINDSADGDQDAEEKADLAEFKKQLPTMKREVARLTEVVERRVKNPAAARTDRTKRTAKGKSRKGRPASLKLYVIEARIADIEPPIFRKLAVPGNRTLADLHAILQDAFGWSDTHLHAFVVRGEEYGVPSLDDYAPVIDEKGITLDELRLRRRSHFEYVYDFGDAWWHNLLVHGSVPMPPGDQDYPVCLDAARARPPEDIGGVPGYEDGIAVMAGEKPGIDDYDGTFFSWTGDYDPEYCDIDAISEALRKD